MSRPTDFIKEYKYYTKDWHDYYHCIVSLISNNMFVYEIGCGRGGLLKYLNEIKNCTVTGCDSSDTAIQLCKKKGIKVDKIDIEKQNIKGKYDVIILCAVLEHLLDPLGTLKKIKKNIKKDFFIIVGVPNFSFIKFRLRYLIGANAKRFGESEEDKRLGVQPYGHIQFFNKATLMDCLKKANYKPIEWRYHKYPLDVFSSFIAVKAKK